MGNFDPIYTNGDWIVQRIRLVHVHNAARFGTAQECIRCWSCKRSFCVHCKEISPEDVEDFLWLKKLPPHPNTSLVRWCGKCRH